MYRKIKEEHLKTGRGASGPGLRNFPQWLRLRSVSGDWRGSADAFLRSDSTYRDSVVGNPFHAARSTPGSPQGAPTPYLRHS